MYLGLLYMYMFFPYSVYTSDFSTKLLSHCFCLSKQSFLFSSVSNSLVSCFFYHLFLILFDYYLCSFCFNLFLVITSLFLLIHYLCPFSPFLSPSLPPLVPSSISLSLSLHSPLLLSLSFCPLHLSLFSSCPLYPFSSNFAGLPRNVWWRRSYQGAFLVRCF